MTEPQAPPKKAAKKTEYLVLIRAEGKSWDEVDTFQGTPESARRAAVDSLGEAYHGEPLAAVPARSWHVEEYEVEVERRVRPKTSKTETRVTLS